MKALEYLKIIVVVLLIGGIAACTGTKDKNINPADALKLKQADHYFFEQDYRRALNMYRELSKKYLNHALLNYKIGKCHLELDAFELAIEYFRNAKNLDSLVRKELYFEYGIALHREGYLDDAVESFNHFKLILDNKENKIEDYDVDFHIQQCNNAKKMMENPVDVEIRNLGRAVNSRHGDYGPSISADGKTMIFTSRRIDNEGGGIDTKGDHKYYEDIYISKWDSAKGEWGSAVNIPGRLNSEGHDAALTISPDGNYIYIYRNDGQVYIGDIFVSKLRSTGQWGTPKALEKPVNTTYFESSASISSDGNKLFFVSERPRQGKEKSQGQSDIWVSDRISKYQWSEPRNLGPTINTKYDEGKVYLHPDGKTIFFASNGHNTMGGYDIFASYLQENGAWSAPVNLGYPINTVRDEAHFVLTFDKKKAYYSSVSKDGFGEEDIYEIDMSKYPWDKVIKEIPTGIVKGKITSSVTSEPIDDALITFSNPNTGIRVGSTSTNEDGSYFITLAKGNYKVKVEKDDFTPFEMSLTVDVNDNDEVPETKKNIQMTAEQ